MTNQVERNNYIQTIRQLPDHLSQLVADMSDTQLDFSRALGDWSTRQIVHHLADSHMNAYIRSKLIVTEDRPPLKGYDQEAWAEMPDAKTLPLAVSLAILDGLHNRWATFFENVYESDWGRIGLHSADGEMTLDTILEHYAWHCDNHIAQIETLREAQGLS